METQGRRDAHRVGCAGGDARWGGAGGRRLPTGQPGRYPVILSHGVYAKGLPFNGDIYRMQWEKLVAKDPTVLEGSSNRYQSWEVTDPERWVPHGYAVVRVDSRGAGRSPGVLDPRSPQEYEDVCASVTWAGTQSWSTGKVAVMGISYYAVMAWAAAERNPEHLAAIVAWEGFNDPYRDAYYHGGILSEFTRRWQPNQIDPIQYGRGERAPVNPNTGLSVAGDVTLSGRGAGRQPGRRVRCHQGAPAGRRLARRPPDRPIEGSRSRCSPRPTGAARGSIPGAISTASSSHRRQTSGSRPTATRTGPTSIRRTGAMSRSGSSTISSRARTTVGTARPASSSTSATRASGSYGGARTNGPSLGRIGPAITSTPT